MVDFEAIGIIERLLNLFIELGHGCLSKQIFYDANEYIHKNRGPKFEEKKECTVNIVKN